MKIEKYQKIKILINYLDIEDEKNLKHQCIIIQKITKLIMEATLMKQKKQGMITVIIILETKIIQNLNL